MSTRAIPHLLSALCWLMTTGMLLTACSKSDEFVYTDENEDGTLTITVTDEHGDNTSLAAGSGLGVYVVNGDGTATSQQVVVDENGRAVLATSSAADTRVVVYTPFQAAWDANALAVNQEFRVQEDQSALSGYADSDLMIGVWDRATATDRTVVLRHVMSKLAVHIIDDTGRVNLKDISAQVRDVNTSVRVQLWEASVTTVSEVRSNVQMLPEHTTDWRISFYAILAPQTLPEGAEFLRLAMGGYDQPFRMPQTGVLESGKSYTLNLRLTTDGLVVEGCTVADWHYEDERSIDVSN